MIAQNLDLSTGGAHSIHFSTTHSDVLSLTLMLSNCVCARYWVYSSKQNEGIIYAKLCMSNNVGMKQLCLGGTHLGKMKTDWQHNSDRITKRGS